MLCPPGKAWGMKSLKWATWGKSYRKIHVYWLKRWTHCSADAFMSEAPVGISTLVFFVLWYGQHRLQIEKAILNKYNQVTQLAPSLPNAVHKEDSKADSLSVKL